MAINSDRLLFNAFDRISVSDVLPTGFMPDCIYMQPNVLKIYQFWLRIILMRAKTKSANYCKSIIIDGRL